MKYFEWDKNKRKINLKKHGVDFIDAVEIFSDIDRIEFKVLREGEERAATIGKMRDIVIFLVYTVRQGKRRIISARRASKNEREAYEEKNEG